MRENESVGVLHAVKKLAEQRALARTRLAGDADAPRCAILRAGETEAGETRNERLPPNEVAGAIIGKVFERVAFGLLPGEPFGYQDCLPLAIAPLSNFCAFSIACLKVSASSSKDIPIIVEFLRSRMQVSRRVARQTSSSACPLRTCLISLAAKS